MNLEVVMRTVIPLNFHIDMDSTVCKLTWNVYLYLMYCNIQAFYNLYFDYLSFGGLVIAANILALVRSPGHILTITNT